MGILEHSPRKLTYDDYLRIPEDGLRREIVDGVEVVTPSPAWNHQKVQGGVHRQLARQVEDRGRGEVVMAPMDVRLSRTDVVQPDVLAVAEEHGERITPGVVDGPPDLVVEILSPSTAKHDRGPKRDAYDRCGVREIWFIDIATRTAERWSRSGDGELVCDGAFQGELPSHAFPGVVLDLQELWKRLRF